MPRNLPMYSRLRTRSVQRVDSAARVFAVPQLNTTPPLPSFLLKKSADITLPRAHTFAGRQDRLRQHSSLQPHQSPQDIPVWRRGYKDGKAQKALFNQPTGMTVDQRGNLFVADTLNHCIRRVAPNGRVKTWVGNGTQGHHDSRGQKARLNRPTGIALGPEQSLLVVDQGNAVLRFISPQQEVLTLPLPAAPLGGISYARGYVYLTLKHFDETVLLRLNLSTRHTALLTHWEGHLQWLDYRAGDEERPFSRWWQAQEHSPRPYALAPGPRPGLGLCVDQHQTLIWAEGARVHRLALDPLQLQTQTLELPLWPAPRWQGIQALPDGSLFALDAEHQAVYHITAEGVTLAADVPEGLDRPYALAQNAYGQVFISDSGHWRICRLNLPGNGPLLRLAQLAFLPHLPQLQEPIALELKKGVHSLVKRYLNSPKSEAPLPALPGIAQQYILDVLDQGKQAQQLACVKELTDVLSTPPDPRLKQAAMAQARPLLEAMLSHEDTAVRTLLIQRLGDTVHGEQEALCWLELFEAHPESNRLLKKYRLEILAYLGKRYRLYGHAVPLMVQAIHAEEEDVVDYAFSHLMKIREAGYATLVDPLIEALRKGH